MGERKGDDIMYAVMHVVLCMYTINELYESNNKHFSIKTRCFFIMSEVVLRFRVGGNAVKGLAKKTSV